GVETGIPREPSNQEGGAEREARRRGSMPPCSSRRPDLAEIRKLRRTTSAGPGSKFSARSHRAGPRKYPTNHDRDRAPVRSPDKPATGRLATTLVRNRCDQTAPPGAHGHPHSNPRSRSGSPSLTPGDKPRAGHRDLG